jgi:hypothetical protein
MGLFRSEEPLFADALRTRRKAATKVIQRVVQSESVLAIAVDDRTHDTTVVVTDARVLVMRRGGRELEKAYALGELPGAYAEGAFLVLDRVGVRVHAGDHPTAASLTTLVNRLVLRHRPRAIPTLDPWFSIDLLRRAGVPDTAVNRARVAERTAFAIGTQAGAFTAQLGDPAAFSVFTRRFADTPVPDEMIDWLWAWHPLCHHGLTKYLAQWHDDLLQPGSFLTDAAGGEIPPWTDRPTAEAWRAVFHRNQR